MRQPRQTTCMNRAHFCSGVRGFFEADWLCSATVAFMAFSLFPGGSDLDPVPVLVTPGGIAPGTGRSV